MKPQDFFVGIREFLSLVVPGAVLLLLWPWGGMHWLAGLIRSDPKEKVDATLLLFVFFVAALGLGGMLGGIGALVDNKVDRLIKRVSENESWRFTRWLLEKTVQRLPALRSAAARGARTRIDPMLLQDDEPLRRKSLPDDAVLEETRACSTRSFWWSYLRLHCPVAIMELDRVEALQKQFRSFVPVAVLMALATPAKYLSSCCKSLADLGAIPPGLWPTVGLTALWAAIGFACFGKYVGLRVQFARRLYEFAIVYDASAPDKASTKGEAVAG